MTWIALQIVTAVFRGGHPPLADSLTTALYDYDRDDGAMLAAG
jgi:hypothetical protein